MPKISRKKKQEGYIEVTLKRFSMRNFLTEKSFVSSKLSKKIKTKKINELQDFNVRHPCDLKKLRKVSFCHHQIFLTCLYFDKVF